MGQQLTVIHNTYSESQRITQHFDKNVVIQGHERYMLSFKENQFYANCIVKLTTSPCKAKINVMLILNTILYVLQPCLFHNIHLSPLQIKNRMFLLDITQTTPDVLQLATAASIYTCKLVHNSMYCTVLLNIVVM